MWHMKDTLGQQDTAFVALKTEHQQCDCHKDALLSLLDYLISCEQCEMICTAQIIS